MEIFLKVTALILMTAVIGLYLSKQAKDFSVILILAACCIVFVGVFSYLSPVLDFVNRLQELGQLNPQVIGVMLKVVGITLLSEITCLICADSGNAAMGKALHILGVAVVLWVSLPVFQSLLELVEDVLVSA